MPKVSPYAIDPNELISLKKELFGTLKKIGISEDTQFFLRYALAESEIVMLARRLQIAQMIITGTPHFTIVQKLGVGWSTIATVNKWLNGPFKSYKKKLTSISTNT